MRPWVIFKTSSTVFFLILKFTVSWINMNLFFFSAGKKKVIVTDLLFLIWGAAKGISQNHTEELLPQTGRPLSPHSNHIVANL